MEMDNAALMQILNTQNMLLQNMQNAPQANMPNVPNASMSANVAMPMQTQPSTPIGPQPFNGYSMYEPLMTQPTPIYSSGRRNGQVEDGIFSQTINTFANYDPSRNSKESTSEIFAEQTRNVQEKVVGGTSALAQGAAFAGSFMVPGILPSLAVGLAGGALVSGTIGAVSSGVTTANDLQEILRKKGHMAFNAFESTTEFGGVGIDLEDRQDLSKYMRHLAPEKLLEDKEMQQILNGALDNKLLKSTSDIESFKKKFDNIVDSVKQITLTMNQSIEEATAFMGELERRGIGTKDMSMISAQTKVVSSLWGVDPSKGAQRLLGTADSITQGTSLDASRVMGSLSYSATVGSLVEEKYRKEDPEMYQYLKNNGGTDQVSMNTEKRIRSYIENEQGRSQLIGILGSAFEKKGDKFEMNMEKFNEISQGIENGTYSINDLQSKANVALSGLSAGDKAKLQSAASEQFANNANGTDLYAFAGLLQKLFAQSSGVEDEAVGLQQMGLANSLPDAENLKNMIEMSKNPNVNKLLYSKTIREEMDSFAQSHKTGIMDSAKYWWKRNVSVPFGDAGQYVSDSIAGFSTDFQKWQTGIGDRTIVGGEMLEEFSHEKLRDKTEIKSINELLESQAKKIRNTKDASIEDAERAYIFEKGLIKADDLAKDERMRISDASFEGMLTKIDKETITGTDLRKLQDQLKSGKLEGIDKQRAEYITKKSNGEYDGFMGTLEQAYDRASIAFTPETPIWGSGKDLDKKMDISNRPEDTIKALEESGKALGEEGKKLDKKLKETFTKESDLGVDKTEYTKLESTIKSGNVEEVKKMTSNSKVIDLAEKYASFSEKQTKNEKAMKGAKDFSRQSEGYARLADGVSEFVGLTGVFDDGEWDSRFRQYIKYGESFKEQMEEGKLSFSEMQEQSDVMLKQGEELFANMSQDELKKIAETLQKKTNGQVRIESLLSENGTIDSQKVFHSIANDVVRPGHADKTDSIVNGKEGDGKSKEAKEAAKDHEKAMGDFITTFKKETADLKAAIKEIKNGSYGTRHTSLG